MPPLSRTMEQDFNCCCYQQKQKEGNLSNTHLLPTKRVRFDDHTRQPAIAYVGELNPDEIVACWYTRADYYQFQQDITLTLHMMMYEPNCIDNINFTSRGLECRLAVAVDRRHKVKMKAWTAVLAEQACQNDSGEGNQEWIAFAYGKCCHSGDAEALDLARLDQLDAARYQHETTRFDDEWISSLSSSGKSNGYERASLEPTFDDDEGFGFDDSWITEVAKA